MSPRNDAEKREPRWWPAILILASCAVAMSWIWFGMEGIRQDRVTSSATALGLSVIALVIWAAAFSRFPRRVRIGVLLGFLLPAVAVPALFRIRGVSGDLIPILEFRWTPKPDARLGADAPASVVSEATSPAPGAPPAAAPESEEDAASPAEPPMSTEPPALPAAPAHLDFPQFLGPKRDATIEGFRPARDWTANPPRLVWRQKIGAGWSGFAVSGGTAVTQEQRGDREMVVAYELTTGRAKWTHADNLRYESAMAGDGPRATPSISGGRVYALGATGILNCLDLETGKRIWTRDIVRDSGARDPQWGRSGSPLVLGDLVIVSAGGAGGKSLLAYRTDSGAPVWHGGDDAVGYSSPVLITLAGVRQILSFNQASVAAHDPGTGQVLWSFPWPARQPNVAQPLPVGGDRLVISSGYGVGSKMLRIRKDSSGSLAAEALWESPRLKAKFANLVEHRGFIYGLDDGILVCLDPENGERRWKSGRYGHGQLLLVGDLLLVQTEAGEIVLVDPDPGEHRELTSFAALDSKTWNPPCLAAPYLLVRNDLEAACYEIPSQP